MFQKILIPLDGTARAEEILSAVLPLTTASPSITLLAVLDAPTTPDAEVLEAIHDVRKKCLLYLYRVAENLRELGCHTTVDLIVGTPAESILEVQRTQEYDLVALSSHGRSGLQRLLKGSVAEAIIRHATTPVLVLKTDTEAPAQAEPIVPRRRPEAILVPLDGSPSAEQALDLAAGLARGTGAVLHLVRASPAITSGVGVQGDWHPGDPSGEREYLAQVTARMSVQCVSAAAFGPADQVLADYAQHHAVDLIVMNTHGRTGARRVLMGSVTESLLRTCRTPILVQRALVEAAQAETDDDDERPGGGFVRMVGYE